MQGDSMKIKMGSLVQIQHFGSSYNGKIGVVIYVFRKAGFRDSYAVKIPNYKYEIGLSGEQCKVIA